MNKDEDKEELKEHYHKRIIRQNKEPLEFKIEYITEPYE